MVDPASAPATKQDVHMIMEQFSKLGEWKEEIIQLNKGWKDEIIHEFKLIAENIRYDAMGAQKDRLEDHEHRIKRLETHTKIAA